MMKQLLIGLAFLLTLGAAHATEPKISGELDKGLRILTVPKKAKKLTFTVYRGDYVKFRYDEKLGDLEFAMPEFKYQEKVQPDPEKSKLFKMLKEGNFPFTLGKIHGEMKIIEFTAKHYQALAPSETKEFLEKTKPLILDVRTAGEFSGGHLKDALLLPVQELQSRFGELDRYRNQDIFIYCASGNRSTVAGKILTDLGFKRIYNFRGGFNDLVNLGLPVEK